MVVELLNEGGQGRNFRGLSVLWLFLECLSDEDISIVLCDAWAVFSAYFVPRRLY